MLKKLVHFLSLKFIKGSRTQATLLGIIVVNLMVHIGLLPLSPMSVHVFNKFAGLIALYFYAEKVSK